MNDLSGTCKERHLWNTSWRDSLCDIIVSIRGYAFGRKAVELRYLQLNDFSNRLAEQVSSQSLVDCLISAEPKRRTLDLTMVDWRPPYTSQYWARYISNRVLQASSHSNKGSKIRAGSFKFTNLGRLTPSMLTTSNRRLEIVTMFCPAHLVVAISSEPSLSPICIETYQGTEIVLLHEICVKVQRVSEDLYFKNFYEFYKVLVDCLFSFASLPPFTHEAFSELKCFPIARSASST